MWFLLGVVDFRVYIYLQILQLNMLNGEGMVEIACFKIVLISTVAISPLSNYVVISHCMTNLI